MVSFCLILKIFHDISSKLQIIAGRKVTTIFPPLGYVISHKYSNCKKTHNSIGIIYSIHIYFRYKSNMWSYLWISRSTVYFKAVYSVFINGLQKENRFMTSHNSVINQIKIIVLLTNKQTNCLSN